MMKVVVPALAVAALGCGEGEPILSQVPPLVEVRLELIASGLTAPIHLTAPSGDPRLFVVEQLGRIRIVEDGQLSSVPFLDITNKVSFGGERGLFSLAFHPQYATNGYFFVNYTDVNGDTRVERYKVSSDPDRADPASAKLILSVAQPASNHNGGHIVFGPDGMLYIAMGDGGG
ncbi:MAG TPA: PQQ-dependent sugar dehydrogenase, partial [Longimicrobiales bacterium]|nr:PQQ-dependent sugar dehydrogenase [Longimicrobiales bacterium]